MSATVFVNGVTLTDAGWFNDVDNAIYDEIFNVKNSAYGAIGDGSTNDRTAVQAAMDACGAAGGGVVLLPPGTYLCHTATTSGGISNCLATKYDNVELRLEAGAVLKTDIDANLIGCGGFYKPGGTTGWATYNARDSANYGGSPFTLYAISSAAKYANAVVLSTPAQSSNFAIADWILVRTGETLTSGTKTPIGEYNKIKAINGGTGALTLEYPLRNTYAVENYPVGHASAGLPAPFGIVNLTQPTNVILQNFRITGKGRIENTSAVASTTTLINGNQSVGRVIDGPEFLSYGNCFSEGSTLSRHVNTKMHMLAAVAGIGYSQDSCNHDWLLDDSLISSASHAQIHLHEGCSGKIGSGVTIISATPVASANSISIRARSHDISIGDIKISGFGADANSPAIFADTDTDRITIGDAHIVGATNSNALAVSVGGTNSNIGFVNTDTGVTVSPDLGNRLGDSLAMFVPAPLMQIQQGAPTLGTVVSGAAVGWTQAHGSSTGMTFSIRTPESWTSAKIRFWYVNLSANAGDVRFFAGWQVAGDGTVLSVISGGNFPFTETAGAQNALKKSAIGSGTIGSLGPTKTVHVVAIRVGGDAADTLNGSIALIGVELIRTR